MFTGIIECVGTVATVQETASGRRIEIRTPGWPERPQEGESIAVDGCCLTLVAVVDGRLAFDVVSQTLERTTLGSWTPGRRVNLERSSSLTTLLGGHLVQGHVDGTGRVEHVARDDADWRLRIEPPEPAAALLTPQGSIAVDGVSLTIAATVPGGAARPGWFEVALIPQTLARTTLRERRAGDLVNIEADAIAKLVHEAVRQQLRRLDL